MAFLAANQHVREVEVGRSDATVDLRTGDEVRVDGGSGRVEILESYIEQAMP